jgi:hypothetical protein
VTAPHRRTLILMQDRASVGDYSESIVLKHMSYASWWGLLSLSDYSRTNEFLCRVLTDWDWRKRLLRNKPGLARVLSGCVWLLEPWNRYSRTPLIMQEQHSWDTEHDSLTLNLMQINTVRTTQRRRLLRILVLVRAYRLRTTQAQTGENSKLILMQNNTVETTQAQTTEISCHSFKTTTRTTRRKMILKIHWFLCKNDAGEDFSRRERHSEHTNSWKTRVETTQADDYSTN